MDISMWSSYLMEFSPEDMIARFAEKGWHHLELSTEHAAALLERGNPQVEGERFAAVARDHNVSVSQGHLWLTCDITNPQHADALRPWLDLFMAAGITHAVIHPGGHGLRERGAEPTAVKDAQCHALAQLVEHVGDADLTLCLENMAHFEVAAEDLIELIRAAGEKHLAICLDTGHLNMVQVRDQAHFIRAAGPLLQALHIADNAGERDDHIIPYGRGTVAWPEVMKALRTIDCGAPLNFEIPGESIRCPLSLRLLKLDYIKSIATYMVQEEGGAA